MWRPNPRAVRRGPQCVVLAVLDPGGLRQEERSGAALAPARVRAVPWSRATARGFAGRRASRGDSGYGNPQPRAANYGFLGFD